MVINGLDLSAQTLKILRPQHLTRLGKTFNPLSFASGDLHEKPRGTVRANPLQYTGPVSIRGKALKMDPMRLRIILLKNIRLLRAVLGFVFLSNQTGFLHVSDGEPSVSPHYTWFYCGRKAEVWGTVV